MVNKIPPGGRLPLKEAKAKVLTLLQQGETIGRAMHLAGRQHRSMSHWRKTDKDFSDRVEIILGLRQMTQTDRREHLRSDFAEFREKFLGMKTFTHQQQWIDVIEGRDPRDLHPNVTFEPGQRNFILINCPPDHAKSMTLSIDYPTYCITKDPDERILIVSETQKRAKEYLYAIKQRLTHPRYSELQLAFAPSGGYKANADSWRDDLIYLGSESRDSPEKDPTIQALGIGGQIYGARCTKIILDDCVVLSNAHRYEDTLNWIQQEVQSRLGPAGKLIVAGTRVAPIDLYREIRNPDRYPDGKSPWTCLSQPAVLEYDDDPNKWVTLWPKSDRPWVGLENESEPDEDGLYPRWDGFHLRNRRGILPARTWSLVYMQGNVSEDAVFDQAMVRKCVNGNRTVGPLLKDNPYHRDGGMDGMYVICSMDPAMAGDTATIAYAVDMHTHKRYVLDANRMQGPTPKKIRDLIAAWTEKFSPNVWMIEKNAFQLFLTRDEEIRSYLASRGVIMREHYTGAKKLDPDFGVASLAPLFTEQLIELPSTHNSEGCKSLVEQLVTWQPGMKAKDLKQDLPMALWFAEIVAREMVERRTMGRKSRSGASRFVPRYAQRRHVVIDMDDYTRQKEQIEQGYSILPAM